MSRFFSKRQKAAIWYEAEGRCERCGCHLPAENFHGDHVTPWRAGGETTVYNGAALCAECNLKKGGAVLRSHQRRVQEIVREARITPGKDVLLADIHPGGGKSALPMIVANELMRHKIDKVCWVVPRMTLQKQAAKASLDGFLRSAIGHSFEFRESTNEADPSRGQAGYVTTYQAIGVDKPNERGQRLSVDEFRRYRYALVLDEPHHVLAGSDWHRQLQPLWDEARYRVLMTGTLTRGDRKPVAFMQYDEDGLPLAHIDGWDYVRYSRTDALKERAIVPLNFSFGQGKVEWVDLASGEVRRARLEDSEDDEVRQAIRCALRSDYAEHLIERAVSDWKGYRSNHYRHAQMIVVAPDQHTARSYIRMMKSMGVPAEIATSDDGEVAQKRIDSFVDGKIPAIVTVAMAYEGLDVKSATHIVGLTHYRSTPWIEQMLNRVTRFDPRNGNWESQQAFAFLPDDALMREVVEKIKLEQDDALRDERTPPTAGAAPPPKKEIHVMGGEMSGTRAQGLDDGLHIDALRDEEMRDLMRESGIEGIIPTQKLAEIFSLHERRKAQPSAAQEFVMDAPKKTAKEREKGKRDRIEAWARKRDKELDLDWGSTNKWLMEVFRKKRDRMTEAELDRVIQFTSDLDRRAA